MNDIKPQRGNEGLVGRAEEFLKSVHIKPCRTGPVPKHEGTGRNYGQGRAIQWLLDHVKHESTECLTWPFSLIDGRPGLIGYQGKVVRSTRLMCLLAHGEPPSDKHEVGYSCGRYDKGCINPCHISWKTTRENRIEQKRIRPRNWFGRAGTVSPKDAKRICDLAHSGASQADIGDQFGIKRWRVADICKGKYSLDRIRGFSVTKRGGILGKIMVKNHTLHLGTFKTERAARAAYLSALNERRLGKLITLPKRTFFIPGTEDQPSTTRRHYLPEWSSGFVNNGDGFSPRTAIVEADQEQSTFLMHNALSRLHPTVRKFVLAATETGDVTEAAQAAGLNESQVTLLLPRLKAFLGLVLE